MRRRRELDAADELPRGRAESSAAPGERSRAAGLEMGAENGGEPDSEEAGRDGRERPERAPGSGRPALEIDLFQDAEFGAGRRVSEVVDAYAKLRAPRLPQWGLTLCAENSVGRDTPDVEAHCVRHHPRCDQPEEEKDCGTHTSFIGGMLER
jgi:hypothetical protein